MRKIMTLAAGAVAVAIAGQALAGNIGVNASGVPTLNLPGFTTWTVTVASDSGAVNGVDATFNGPLNQVNPFGLGTIFQDNNAVLPAAGANVQQDTQFNFLSGQILSLATAEGPNLLTGALTNLAPFNGLCPICGAFELELAQLVIPDGSSVEYGFRVDDGSGVAIPVSGVIGAPVVMDPILGPSGSLAYSFNGETQSLTLENTGEADVVFGAPSITGPDAGLFALVNPDLSDLAPGATRGFDVKFAGNIPNEFATYTAALTFPSNSVEGDVVWDLTATVPEPSTVALTGLALVGLVGFARRRNG